MAAGQTYTPIASTTLSSNTTDVSFSSIPGTYTDLILVIAGAGSSNDLQVGLRFNDDATVNGYSITELSGNGTTATSYRVKSTLWSLSPSVSILNTLGQSVYTVNIMNYANTTTYKTGLCRLGAIGSTYPGTAATVGLWIKTNAITKITAVGAFLSGSVLTLYGIQAA